MGIKDFFKGIADTFGVDRPVTASDYHEDRDKFFDKLGIDGHSPAASEIGHLCETGYAESFETIQRQPDGSTIIEMRCESDTASERRILTVGNDFDGQDKVVRYDYVREDGSFHVSESRTEDMAQRIRSGEGADFAPNGRLTEIVRIDHNPDGSTDRTINRYDPETGKHTSHFEMHTDRETGISTTEKTEYSPRYVEVSTTKTANGTQLERTYEKYDIFGNLMEERIQRPDFVEEFTYSPDGKGSGYIDRVTDMSVYSDVSPHTGKDMRIEERFVERERYDGVDSRSQDRGEPTSREELTVRRYFDAQTGAYERGERDIVRYDANGDVESVVKEYSSWETKVEYHYDGDGNLVSERVLDKRTHEEVRTDYDPTDGSRTEARLSISDDGNETTIEQIRYDSEDRKVYQEGYNADGEHYRSTYSYDTEKGEVSIYTSYDTDGRYEEVHRFEDFSWSTDGTRDGSVAQFGTDGKECTFKETYTDSDGNRVDVYTQDKIPYFGERIEITYKEGGIEVSDSLERTTRMRNGEDITTHTDTRVTYDSDGGRTATTTEITRHVLERPEEQREHTVIRTEYDKEGNVKMTESDKTRINTFTQTEYRAVEKTEYTRDDDGRLIESRTEAQSVSEDGTTTGTMVREYDSDGKIAKETSDVNYNGEVREITINEYVDGRLSSMTEIDVNLTDGEGDVDHADRTITTYDENKMVASIETISYNEETGEWDHHIENADGTVEEFSTDTPDGEPIIPEADADGEASTGAEVIEADTDGDDAEIPPQDGDDVPEDQDDGYTDTGSSDDNDE